MSEDLRLLLLLFVIGGCGVAYFILFIIALLRAPPRVQNRSENGTGP
jgi:hypothetical protein